MIGLLCFCHFSFAGNLNNEKTKSSSIAETHYKGKNLVEVLTQLNQQGYHLLFSSQIIHRGMVIKTEPSALKGVNLIKQLLAPFKLDIAKGPKNSFIVVAKRQYSIAGNIVDAATGEPINHVQIILHSTKNVEASVEKSNAEDTASPLKTIHTTQSSFTFSDLALDTYILEIEAFGYLPQSVKHKITQNLAFELKNERHNELNNEQAPLAIKITRLPIEKITISIERTEYIVKRAMDTKTKVNHD